VTDTNVIKLAQPGAFTDSLTENLRSGARALEARLEEQAQCILVIIGATPEGKKELIGFIDGMRESSQS
jgi:transposase-like protein